MLKLYVRCCSDMLLDLCPEVLSPRNTKIWSGFWRAIFFRLGQMQGSKQHFGPRLGPNFIPVKVSGSYSSASWGKVGGSWGQVGLSGGHVQANLGYAMICWSYMSDFLRPCCWFCIQTCSPQQDSRTNFQWVSASYVGSIWGLPCGYVGAILGPTSVILGLCWRLYGIILDHVAPA